MGNIRKIAAYKPDTEKIGFRIEGRMRWVNKADAYDARAKIPGHFGIKIDGKNFFFPTTDQLSNGAANPFWSVDDNKISRTIPPIYFPRIRIDTKIWRDAIIEMEMKPWNWRVKAQTVMQDVILDAHVKGCAMKRKRMTLKKKPTFFDAKGNAIENNKDLAFINKRWWYQLIDFILDAQFYGYQLIELGEMDDNMGFPDISIVPRQNISPDREIVASVVYNVNGIPFSFNKNDYVFRRAGKDIKAPATAPNGERYYDWTVWIKTPNEFGAHTSTCGYGLFYWVGLYAVLIRNNLQYNADFIEKYIQPIPWMKTNKTDPAERQAAFDSLVKMGSSAAFLTDLTDELTFLEAAKSGTGHSSYGDFEDRMQKGISFLLLGHRDAVHTTPGRMSSGQGQEEAPVNKAMLEVENEQDKWIGAVVEEDVLPKLRRLGFKIPEDITYGYLNDEQDNLEKEQDNKHNKDFADVINVLTQAGFEVPEKFITEYTGIPVTKSVQKVPSFGEDTPDEEEISDVKNLHKILGKQYLKHTH